MRNYAILNIIVKKTKIFGSKSRASQICLEIFRPEELLEKEQFKEIYRIDKTYKNMEKFIKKVDK